VASAKLLGKFLPTMSDEKTEAALRNNQKSPLEELIETKRNQAQKDRKWFLKILSLATSTRCIVSFPFDSHPTSCKRFNPRRTASYKDSA
jgi:hypothetical protein